MEHNILKRDQVPEEFTWDLSDIFPSDEAWSAEYELLKKLPERLAAFEGHLSDSAESLLAFFRLEDEADERLGKLHCYANCKSDQDTADSFYLDMRGKAVSVYVAASSAAAFATSELIAMDEERLESFYTAESALETYRRVIERIRRRAAHTLSAPEERLLAAAGEMADSPDNICGILRNADLKFPPVKDSEGVEHPLTAGSFVPLLESSDRSLRRRAFETYYHRIGEFKNTIAASLDAQFKQLNFFSQARRYEDTLTAALDANELSVPVYTGLIEAVHANMEKMYRYVRLRKRLMGLEEVHMYDVYTPLISVEEEKISYEQAKTQVLEGLSVLGEDYCALLRQGFDQRWIDVYENVGKRSGAYSTGSSRPHPYVLLNHKDNLDSMFTLAHEMGHALHSYHSCAHQPVCTSDYVIFVAEVASTCNEVLLMRHLLANTKDKQRRLWLINHFLDQFKGTLFRQTMFAEFEMKLGEMSGRGETLTAEALSREYHELNKLYFGPDMVSDDEIALEWARIPHFFYNYYVYQYATGFSAAVAIAQRILSGVPGAVEDYKRFLSSGSSADPISLLKIAGVDMSTPQPVNEALALFDELLDEMESLI